ncbi:hypothetical protein DM02DRAFT_619899 [Periconia macrospinosa]|uniref:Methylmalonyl-CoA epimerase n=1 Tax=Periconia macrospinosa TaxID=97972 RepID=A0A2V1D394_9PLEO|nr:hypothetical protein DM02DRAFT_619899 [Periconia macrospinosa]
MATALTPSSSPLTVSPSFLGNIDEICIVTPDVHKTISGLARLGIGPFHVFDFTPETVTEQTYRGAPSTFSLKVAFATHNGVVWELMQPVSGPSIMAEFLERRGEGIHHIAFDCNHVEPKERRNQFERRGFSVVQSGVWHGRNGTCEFVFYDTDGAIGTCFESYCFSEDWEDPEEAG